MQGINEQQKLFGTAGMQHRINEENYAVLKAYVNKWGAAAVGVAAKKLKRYTPSQVSCSSLFGSDPLRASSYTPCAFAVRLAVIVWDPLPPSSVLCHCGRDMATLYSEITASKTGIHPKVLSLAADIVRMLHGARLTCCKVRCHCDPHSPSWLVCSHTLVSLAP